jgi:hypothetical protein
MHCTVGKANGLLLTKLCGAAKATWFHVVEEELLAM